MFDDFAIVNSQIYFGKYINESVLNDLKQLKIDIIVNLTHETDYAIPYHCDLQIINFPILDMDIGNDHDVKLLIIKLMTCIKNNKNIYIHCIGGHGRSAVIAACLYGICYDKSANESLKKIKEAHQKRKIMKLKWRKLGAPQTNKQISQIFRIIN